MKRICFVLLICVALVCVFLTPCFASSETTAVDPVDWDDPSTTVYYRYITRSGSEWFKDLPADHVTISATSSISRSGRSSSHTSTSFKLEAGDVMYVITGSGSIPAIAYRDRSGTVTNYTLSGYVDSQGAIYYCTSSSLTSFGGDTLYGQEVKSGGAFINQGIDNSLSILGSISTYMFKSSTILVIIGLAVGVTLIGWGFGKVKSFVKGY